MKNLRVIWIDDERDPNKKMPGGIYSWWFHKVPEEFRELCEKEGHPEIIWFKSCTEWLIWATTNWIGPVKTHKYDCVCLDHDLNDFDSVGKEWTGADVARVIVEDAIYNKKKLPYYECHSSNPAGRDNIISIFESYKKIYE